MARIRSIHYNACKSEKLQAASAEAERCFWRLLPHCDDEGRAEDDPRLLRAAMFPLWEELRSALVDRWLDELDLIGLIVRYEVDGKRYLQVAQWGDYQKPNRPIASKLPPPPFSEDSVSAHGAVSEDSVCAHEHVDAGEGVGEGDVIPPPHDKRAGAYEADFDAWYEGYPRKIDRKQALAAYKARRREGIDPERLTKARDEYARATAGSDHIKYAATFLAKDGPWSEWEHGPPGGFTMPLVLGPDAGKNSEAIRTLRVRGGVTQRFMPGAGWISEGVG